jgi:hypothetical protein
MRALGQRVRLSTLDGGLEARGRERLGHALALASGRLAVATLPARLEFATTNVGHVFRFDGGAWQHESALEAPGAEQRPMHRSTGARGDPRAAIALCGDVAVVGSPELRQAWAFRRSDGAWSTGTELPRPTSVAHGPFASSVATNGEVVAVGVHLFARDGEAWVEREGLVGFDADADTRLGGSVALDGDTLVVHSDRMGSALVFRVREGRFAFERELSGGPGVRHVAAGGGTIVLAAPPHEHHSGWALVDFAE